MHNVLTQVATLLTLPRPQNMLFVITNNDYANKDSVTPFASRDVPPPLHTYTFPPSLINCSLFCLLILVHSLHQSIDEGLTVAMVTSLDVVPGLLSVASASIAQLERPEEVACLLEVWPNSDYLMDKVFDTDDPVFAQNLV